MSITVLEALQNAQINFKTAKRQIVGVSIPFEIATEQLSNAIAALESGMSAEDSLQENM